MTVLPTLTTQQGLAYAIAAHGVLKQASARSNCPVALLQTLLALESMNSTSLCFPARTKELQQVMQISLPLLRGYIRDLEQRGYVVRQRFFRRGPRLLKLTPAGLSLLGGMKGNLREAAAQVLDWQAR